MREAPFPFLRATFYRWAQTWPEVSPKTFAAPEVLGVGDLHVENFGTWRDVEERLIWGLNDFAGSLTPAIWFVWPRAPIWPSRPSISR